MSALRVTPLAIPDVLMLWPAIFMDQRGWFSEVYNSKSFAAAGVSGNFPQDNQSYSEKKGTVRGLHYQIGSAAQAKLVRVLRGRSVSVVVDIRRSSPTFGRHVMAKLSAIDGNQLFIPVGFAHGFCTLEPQTEVFYKASSFYAPGAERGINWRDPTLGIPWPVEPADAVLSPKDIDNPMLADQPDLFD